MRQDIDPATALDAAIVHHEAGRTDLAEAGYRLLLETNPDDADALNLLGLIMQDQGNHAEAIALISRALAIDPDFPEALTNLARAKRGIGDASAAVELALRAVALDADLAEAQFQLGRALLDLSRDREAVAPLSRAVGLNPRLTDAGIALGNARMRLHDFTGAAAAFEAALAIEPDRLEALINLGASLLKVGHTERALVHQRHAALVAPGDAVPHAAIGASLRQLGDILGSAEACRRAIALGPDYHDALILLGNNYISLGDFDQAETTFRRALAVSAGSGSARAGLAAIGRGSADEAEIQQLRDRMVDLAASDYERVSAGFALGSVLDRAERYEDAFDAFTAVNGLARDMRLKQGRAFDLHSATRHVAWAKQTFTPALFGATRGWGDPSDRPVFVVGMPRSGTTLVEQIAASHPAVYGAGELRSIPAMIGALDGGPAHVSPLQWDRGRVEALTAAHVAELAAFDPGAARTIDKLPDNVQLLGQIAVLFPNARIILCRRDPRDICLSCYFQYFGDGNEWSFDLAACANRARQIDELVRHWRSVLTLEVLEIDYETLVGDLEGESRRLIGFLGLAWDPACLDFHKADRTVMTASHWQVRQPVYATSIGRWRHYEALIGPLLRGLHGLHPNDGYGGALSGVPGSPPPHTAPDLIMAADAHLKAHEPEKALAASFRAVAAEPGNALGHGLVGTSLIELDRPADAVTPLREAVRLAPGWTTARIYLAKALSRANEHAASADVWRDVLTLDPADAQVHAALAGVLEKLGDNRGAVVHLRRAATLRPDDARIAYGLTIALLHIPEVDGAEVSARRAVMLEPTDPSYHFALAEVLSMLGRFDEAAVHYRKSADLEPESARARAGLVNIGGSLGAETDKSRLRAILADEAVAPDERANAGFALARALDQAGEYDEAFGYFAAANRMARTAHRARGDIFDIYTFRAFIDRTVGLFTPSNFSNWMGHGDPTEQPVFIVGMPRSGTSLVEQILTSHPQVAGRGETHMIFHALGSLDAEAARHGRGHWLAEEIAAKAVALAAEVRAAGGNAVRVTDKMPDNIQNLGQIAMLLPRARVIVCRRDPRDIGLSCFFRNFSSQMDWTFDLTDIALRTVEVERLVKHWRATLPLPMMEVEYESLVTDLEGQSRRLIEFLGLDWDPACLSFHTNKRQVLTASNWQVRQPLYSTSVGQWRNYRQHLGPLIDGLRGLLPNDD